MSPSVQPPPLPGDVVGSFTLGPALGVGGMATVYKSTSPELGTVAVKVLHPGKADTDEARRFKREFLALRQLKHPGIVRVYESGLQGDYPWIAMEYVEGQDLNTLIETWETHPPPDRFVIAAGILEGLCKALSYLHEQGLIHRDLKPSNVLVTTDMQPKLTDFGVVKAPGFFNTQLTVAGRLVGTVAFMSPEQITGETLDARADLYSLGAVLYMMLTGKRPIVASSIAGYLARHLSEAPRPPSELDPNVPPRLERICMQLLEKDPAQRPQTAGQVLEALASEASQEQVTLYGRDADLEQLVSMAERVGKGGRGGIVSVEGPRGMGKSSLLATFVDRVRSLGINVAACSARVPDPLRDLIGQLPDTDLTDPGGTDLGAMVALRVDDEPWVLVADDIDRMTAAELEMLTTLARERIVIEDMNWLLVVACSSPMGGPVGLISGAATGRPATRVQLSGLDQRTVTRLVRDSGLTGPVAAVLSRRMHTDLEGAPGEVLAQIGALVEAGWLDPEPGGELRSTVDMRVLRTQPLPVPAKIRQREAKRLRSLSAQARTVLDGLVVLGMEAPMELVANVTELSIEDVASAAPVLVEAGLVRQWVEGVQELLSVPQGRGRAVFYDLVAPERRRVLHRRAAGALQRRSRRKTGPLAEVIAEHLLKGGQASKAYPLLLRLARRNLDAGHGDRARKLLTQALEARPSAETALDGETLQTCRVQLHTLQGAIAARDGDLPGSLEAWSKAARAVEETGDPEALITILAGRGCALLEDGQMELASVDLEAANDSLTPDDPQWAEVTAALAVARTSGRDLAGAEKLLDELDAQAEKRGKGAWAAHALFARGTLHAVNDDLVAALQAYEGAEQKLRAHRESAGLCGVLRRLAELALADGRLRVARERARESEMAAREAGRDLDALWAQGIGAQALAVMGEAEAARSLALEAYSLARVRGAPRSGPGVLAAAAIARVLLELDRAQEADSLLPEDCYEVESGLQDPTALVNVLHSRIVANRKPARAKALVEKTLLRPAPRLPWPAARVLVDAGHALMRAGDFRGALDAVERALEWAAPLGSRHGELRLLRLEAQVLAHRLDPDGGHGDVVKSLQLALAEEQGLPPDFGAHWL